MKNYIWLFLSIIWTGLILYLSFYNPVSANASEPWFENQDKVGHFVFYAVLSLVLIKTLSQEIVIQNSITVGAIVAFIFGILIELAQHFFTFDRDGDILDAFANGLGIVTLVVLINSYPKLFRFNPKTKTYK